MKIALIIFLIGVVLFVVGKTGLSRKPADTSLRNRLAKEPKQKLLEESDPLAAPIYLKFEKQLYTYFSIVPIHYSTSHMLAAVTP